MYTVGVAVEQIHQVFLTLEEQVEVEILLMALAQQLKIEGLAVEEVLSTVVGQDLMVFVLSNTK
jgi:hypothetical protein